MFSGATAVLARIIVIVPSAWITGQVYKSGSISITDLVSHSLSSYVTQAEWGRITGSFELNFLKHNVVSFS